MSATQDEELRMRTRSEFLGRIDRVEQICRAVGSQGLDPARAAREIELIVTGEADRIVRVGGPVPPQIQTGRD
jgi:hypothetical protein